MLSGRKRIEIVTGGRLNVGRGPCICA